MKDTNYYKVIDNIKYDKALIDTTDESIKGQGDGRISITDCDNLFKKICDKSIITKIEYRTIFYILKNYKFTDESYTYFLDKLSKY